MRLISGTLHLSHGFQCSPTLNRQPYEVRLPLTSWWRKSSNMTVGQYAIQPHILNPPLLRLTSRKPLWLDLQPVDIKSLFQIWNKLGKSESGVIFLGDNWIARTVSRALLKRELKWHLKFDTGTFQCQTRHSETCIRNYGCWLHGLSCLDAPVRLWVCVRRDLHIVALTDNPSV